MNIQQAKEIDITAYLQKMGYQGEKRGEFVWFVSPMRDEKTASFSVSAVKNTWIDFGTGLSGDIIDLLKLKFNTDTAGALKILSEGKTESFKQQTINSTGTNEKNPVITLNRLRPIQSKALLNYLKLRKIPIDLAMIYLQEAFYTVKDRHYFSIAFKNNLGGYELRNQNFKNCIAPKYYTSFPVPGNKELNIFEGFFSYLSGLSYYKIESFPENTFVLNSISNLHLVIPLLPDYNKINSYLDNDQAGRNALDKVRYWNPCTENKSIIIHRNHKDFNEYLVNT